MNKNEKDMLILASRLRYAIRLVEEKTYHEAYRELLLCLSDVDLTICEEDKGRSDD